MHEVVDESLRKICHYLQNVPQHNCVLDALAYFYFACIIHVNMWCALLIKKKFDSTHHENKLKHCQERKKFTTLSLEQI